MFGGTYALSFSEFDFFTNEPGLRAAVRDAIPTGATIAGVSGGMLEIACECRAEAVQVIDASADLVLAVEIVAAILCAAGERAPSWICGRMPVADVIGSLQLSAVREDAIRCLRTVRRQALRPRSRHPGWLRSERDLAHLIDLARRGRIRAFPSDLTGDLSHIPREPIRHVHLSNVADYTVDVAALFANLSALPLAPDCTVTTSSKFLRFLLDKASLQESDRRAIDALGSFDRPAVHRAGELIASGPQLSRALWRTPQHRQRLWQDAIGCVRDRPLAAELAPRTPESFRKSIAALEADVFRDDAHRRAALKVYLERRGLYARLAESDGGWFDRIDVADLHRLRDLPRITSRIERAFWTEPRKAATLTAWLGDVGLSPSDVADFAARTRECDDLEALRHLFLEAFDECDRSFPFWSIGRRNGALHRLLSPWPPARVTKHFGPEFTKRRDAELARLSDLKSLIALAHRFRMEWLHGAL